MSAHAETALPHPRRWMLFGLVLFAVLLVLPAPEGMSPAAWRVTAVGVLMAVWWTTEAIPIPATALLPLPLFPLLGVRPIEPTAAPYANSVVFLYLAGFLLASAMQRSNLHRRLALAILALCGARPDRLVGSLMAATAFISMWVSNTATTAMMLPMATSMLALARERGTDAETERHFAPALMLGLAYAASIGGVGTLIGTPPNALFVGYMRETHGVEIGFARWMVVGVPLAVVGTALTWMLLTRVMHPVGTTPIAGGAEAIRAQRRGLGTMSRAEWTVALVALVAAVLWIARPALEDLVPGLSDAGIGIAAALVLFLVPAMPDGTPVLDWGAADDVPWGVLLLFGGGLALASAMQETGLAEWIGGAMRGLAAWPPLLVLLALAAVIAFLSELASNTAMAAAFLPVAGALAAAIGREPLALAVATTLAASCAFMLPVGTPPNAMVYGTGAVTMRQMMRAGILLDLMFVVLIAGVAAWVVPWAMR